ncbi:MAG: hypothetical protein ACI4HQ_12470 [Acetatifactor sp.]
MSVIYYGVHYFNHNKGSYGARMACPSCGKEYRRVYIKQSKWFHIDYIPLIPLVPDYVKICPVCGDGEKVKGRDAKAEIAAGEGNNASELKPYVKHVKAEKKYEFWYKDLGTGEDMFLFGGLKKGDLKRELKARGLKLSKTEMIEV